MLESMPMKVRQGITLSRKAKFLCVMYEKFRFSHPILALITMYIQDIHFIHLHESTIERFAAMCNFYSTSFILRGRRVRGPTQGRPNMRQPKPRMSFGFSRS